MDTAEQKDYYLVPEQNVEWLRGKFEKLVRRATKLGLNPPTLVELRTHDFPMIRPKRTEQKPEIINLLERGLPTNIKDYDIVSYARFVQFKVEGEAPVVPGWDLVAVIDHTTDSEIGNIIRNVPGKECPVEYRKADAYCEHCKTNRYRKETFVLVNEQGRYMKVGRNCLADFCRDVGAAANLVNAAEYLFSAHGLLSEASLYEGGSHVNPRFGIERVLIYTSALIRHFGWVSKTEANIKMIQSTSSLVIESQVVARKDQSRELVEVLLDPEFIQQSDKDNAENALEWIRNKRESGETLNDYLHNLLVVCSQSTIEIKHFGLACSLIPAYLREVGKFQEKEREEKFGPSEFFGEVGKRDIFTLTFVRMVECDGYMGNTVSYRYTFRDEKGNIAIWWSSSSVKPEDWPENQKVKATVKEHKIYNGKKQTILTRVTPIVDKKV